MLDDDYARKRRNISFATLAPAAGARVRLERFSKLFVRFSTPLINDRLVTHANSSDMRKIRGCLSSTREVTTIR